VFILPFSFYSVHSHGKVEVVEEEDDGNDNKTVAALGDGSI
jgi:hypothetical protein